METDDIKLMIMSLGGTPKPLIKSISTYDPDKVIFLASHESVPLSYTILADMDNKPATEFVITENPNSLYECYEKAMECIARARKTEFSPRQIMVDYTGGTKVMTASILMAALGRSYQFNYVGGQIRSKDGLGPVIDGNEIMISEASPWAVFAEEERRQVIALFNNQRYAAVFEILEQFDRKVPPKISDYFNFIKPLALGFLYWDQFNHNAAQRNLEKGKEALVRYMETYPVETFGPFLQSLTECMCHLDDVVESNKQPKKKKPKKFHHSLLKDLINNARRRMADKRFDDAAARIYRSLEMFGQIVFYEVAKCNNSEVKSHMVPDQLKEPFKKYYDPYKKCYKLPLEASFKFLRVMEHEAGKRFFEMKDEIQKVQYNRNYSILAHGNNPVTEKGANSIFNTILKFVGPTELFDFPRLP